jgi:hypothetical protein
MTEPLPPGRARAARAWLTAREAADGRLPVRIVDLAVVLGTGVLALPPVTGRDEPEVAVVGLAMAVALAFRRALPVAVMAAVSVLALFQVAALARAPEGYDLAVLVAMYSVVRYAHWMLSGRSWPPRSPSGW